MERVIGEWASSGRSDVQFPGVLLLAALRGQSSHADFGVPLKVVCRNWRGRAEMSPATTVHLRLGCCALACWRGYGRSAPPKLQFVFFMMLTKRCAPQLATSSRPSRYGAFRAWFVAFLGCLPTSCFLRHFWIQLFKWGGGSLPKTIADLKRFVLSRFEIVWCPSQSSTLEFRHPRRIACSLV